MLGTPALYFPDEGRYAEIGREMLLLHQYATPHLDGLPYFEKPPLAYWGIAFFERLFGFSEWAVRTFNVVMALFICLVLYSTGRLCFNRATGLWAALILSSSILFFTITHLVNTDACFTACLTLALCSFISWVKRNETGQPRLGLLYLVYIFCALAVLAKGLIGMVFPGMILIIWFALTSRWDLLKKMHLTTGILLFLLIALPWHLIAERQNPSFYHEYFYINQYLRFITPVMHRQMNKLMYIGIFIGGFLPWMVILARHIKPLAACLGKSRHFLVESFLICWVLTIFLFFAFSDSILPTYLLPVMPALALLTAPYVSRCWQTRLYKNRLKLSITLILSWLIMMFAWGIIVPHFMNKSTKSLAELTNVLLINHPNAQLINYDYYYQDFPFYTRHFVKIAGWRDELSYGQNTDPSTQVLISDQTLGSLIDSPGLLYILLQQKNWHQLNLAYPNHVFLIRQAGDYILVSNQKTVTP